MHEQFYSQMKEQTGRNRQPNKLTHSVNDKQCVRIS